MAKVRGPLLSQTASGSIAGLMTFSQRKTGQQVRFQRKQRDYVSAGRATQRAKYQAVVQAWNALSPTEKSAYDVLADGKHMSGYNMYVKLNIANAGIRYYGSSIYGDALYGG